MIKIKTWFVQLKHAVIKYLQLEKLIDILSNTMKK